MKQRLLIFHTALAPYRVDFFNALAERFDLLVVFQIRNLRSQQFDQERLSRSVRFRYEFFPRTLDFSSRLVSIGYWRFLREFRPDFVMGSEFGHTVIAPYLLRPFCRKRFRLWTLTDDSMQILHECKGIRMWLRRFFALRLDGLLTANPETSAWYNGRFSVEAPTVPIIFDERKIRETVAGMTDYSLELLDEYDLHGHRIVLFVGRLNPVKNIPALIDALAFLPVDCKLVIVGEGIEREALANKVREKGLQSRVVFAGRYEQPEMFQWYNVADVFVLPSTYEPFGAVVGEALQLGCPVVCSSLAGSSCLISSGRQGRVVDPYDTGAIASAIIDILESASPRESYALRPSLLEHDLDYFIDLFSGKLRG